MNALQPAPTAGATRKRSRRTPPANSGAAERRAASQAEAVYDAQLVQRARDGDEAAFTEIISRYKEKMTAIAYSLLRDRHDAEEIAQDTFVRAYRGLARFRGDCSLVTWLHRITVNLARNRYWFFRRRARHATLSLDCPLSEASNGALVDLMPAPQPTPVREATTTEFAELVNTCMQQLDPAHREILTLRNVLDRSYAEIAQSLGIEEGTVKSRIARARRCLRGLMADACPEFGEGALPADWLELDERRDGMRWSEAS